MYQNEPDVAACARANVQLLINRIFDLPRVVSDMGPLAQLPAPVTILPRAKPLPKTKLATKWAQFASEKGILKRKKSRKVFDDATGEWRHAWGYQRAGDDATDWAVEMKAGDLDDPWTKRKQAKRARVEQNVRAQAKNRQQGRGEAASLPSGIPVELARTGDVQARQRGHVGTAKTLAKVQSATASMGTFDPMRSGEQDRKVKGKRHRFLPTTGAEATEKERSLKVLQRVLRREEKGGKTKDEGDEDEGTRRKKKGKKLKNLTKGATKTRRTK